MIHKGAVANRPCQVIGTGWAIQLDSPSLNSRWGNANDGALI